MALKEVSPQDPDDDVLRSIQLLKDDTKSAFDAFSKKVASGALVDFASLVQEVREMFSLQADLVALTFQAHSDSFEWSGEVEQELDALRGASTTILPEDAARLKATILSLVQNLRDPVEGSDDALAALKLRASEAVKFIDDSTAEDPDDEDDEDEDDEAATGV